LALLLVSLALASAPGAAVASSEAGIQISVGEFRVHLLYSVAVEYPGEAERVVRDPRLMLFSVASLLQANDANFRKIKRQVMVVLDVVSQGTPGVEFLFADSNPADVNDDSSYARKVSPVRRDLSEEVVSVLCGRFAGACARNPRAELLLYPCRSKGCPGEIAFGVFPSATENRRYAIQPSRKGDKPVRVTRANIGRFFEVIAQ
jgi:hypothetical protein